MPIGIPAASALLFAGSICLQARCDTCSMCTTVFPLEELRLKAYICCYRRKPASNAVMSLSDVWHEVPWLRAMLPSKSFTALLAVSQAHRHQIHDHVQHIVVLDTACIQTLVCGTWPSLVTWRLGDSLNTPPAVKHDVACCNLRYAIDAMLSLLAKGHLRSLHHLSFNSSSISAAATVQLHQVSWSSYLQRCSLCSISLSLAAVQAFSACPWPCLKELDLSCTGLTYEAFKEFCLT